ncbi:MAG: hypothetical protein ACXVH1_35250, partial [Solirubrobacteraceae bacterium]
PLRWEQGPASSSAPVRGPAGWWLAASGRRPRQLPVGGHDVDGVGRDGSALVLPVGLRSLS